VAASSEYGNEPSGQIATTACATDTLSCVINDIVRYTLIVPTDICFQPYLPSYQNAKRCAVVVATSVSSSRNYGFESLPEN
jgi:hypothetical protein